MAEEIIKITKWSRIEDNGSGDYFIVPVGLFEMSFEEAAYDDEDFETKQGECIYIGGYADCIPFRGEIKK